MKTFLAAAAFIIFAALVGGKPSTKTSQPTPQSAPLDTYSQCLKEMAFLDKTGGDSAKWCCITNSKEHGK